MKRTILIISLLSLLFPGCVSKRKYTEQAEELRRLKMELARNTETEKRDSTRETENEDITIVEITQKTDTAGRVMETIQKETKKKRRKDKNGGSVTTTQTETKKTVQGEETKREETKQEKKTNPDRCMLEFLALLFGLLMLAVISISKIRNNQK